MQISSNPTPTAFILASALQRKIVAVALRREGVASLQLSQTGVHLLQMCRWGKIAIPHLLIWEWQPKPISLLKAFHEVMPQTHIILYGRHQGREGLQMALTGMLLRLQVGMSIGYLRKPFQQKGCQALLDTLLPERRKENVDSIPCIDWKQLSALPSRFTL
ncbi:hypothetical protein [Ktedonobacter racemifer]|uniref:Uncharacterized protein n=1 Tax=Ktedonobacter racemifer DSM 44963 TaxID=485913 RepID=D6U0L1_KTERA|nr:hypothetical protein [Ktedonobacter racemifer]EFH82351.1 hypothetical protein Krac_3159 [Ktedonobacter racemifer DSM 44963]